jgi:uncharacterized protein
MQMTELTFDGGQPPVDGYGPGGFRVAGQWHEGAVLLSPKGLTTLGDPEDGIALLTGELSAQVDVVIVGQGPEIGPLPQRWRLALEQLRLGVEHMASPTACRTYNVLLGEDRRVAALLVPV